MYIESLAACFLQINKSKLQDDSLMNDQLGCSSVFSYIKSEFSKDRCLLMHYNNRYHHEIEDVELDYECDHGG